MLKKIYQTCLGKTHQKSKESKNIPPTLETDRLILRPFDLADAPGVKFLAGDKAIADTTLNIPHPYDLKKAEEWIASLYPQYEKGKRAVFAMIEDVRAATVRHLYNNPEVWPHFGYEGPSAHLGGYIKRGFNDIAWISDEDIGEA